MVVLSFEVGLFDLQFDDFVEVKVWCCRKVNGGLGFWQFEFYFFMKVIVKKLLILIVMIKKMFDELVKVKFQLLWRVLVVLFICYVGLMVVWVLVIYFGLVEVIWEVFVEEFVGVDGVGEIIVELVK